MLYLNDFNSPILEVGTKPAEHLITSGILLTIVAHVSLTVSGLETTNLVVGSPSTVQSFVSTSPSAYTLPIHSASIIIPYSVVPVTIADIPVALPALTVIFKVEDSISDVCVKGTHF